MSSKEFCSGSTTKARSTRTNKPAITAVRQEQFLTDKERGPTASSAPSGARSSIARRKTTTSGSAQHKEWLLDYLDNRADAVVPDFRQTELRNAVEKLSGDLCISRPKSRLDWGIEFPFDPDLSPTSGSTPSRTTSASPATIRLNRTSSRQPADFPGSWPALHIIGKDILIPAHGIYWPIMLHALGFPDDADAAAARPRLVEHRRRQDEQERRQRRRSRLRSPTNTAPKRCGII